MENKKQNFTIKKELVYCEDDVFPFFHIGYSLCTVCFPKNSIWGESELQNFGYCPHLRDFYYNNNVKLSKDVIEYWERRNYLYLREEDFKKMEELGIYDFSVINKLIDSYKNSEDYDDIFKIKKLIKKR